jgi:hypothetical protein
VRGVRQAAAVHERRPSVHGARPVRSGRRLTHLWLPLIREEGGINLAPL